MSTAKGKSSYHHGDLREALLQAAESLLEEGDVQNLTLRACARQAGVSHVARNIISMISPSYSRRSLREVSTG